MNKIEFEQILFNIDNLKESQSIHLSYIKCQQVIYFTQQLHIQENLPVTVAGNMKEMKTQEENKPQQIQLLSVSTYYEQMPF